jgi:hypothetical protein
VNHIVEPIAVTSGRLESKYSKNLFRNIPQEINMSVFNKGEVKDCRCLVGKGE